MLIENINKENTTHRGRTLLSILFLWFLYRVCGLNIVVVEKAENPWRI